MTPVRSAAESVVRWAASRTWTLQSSLFVAVAFLCLFNCVVLGFLLFLSTQNALPLSRGKAAGSKARESLESVASTQPQQKSPTKAAKQQAHVPTIVVDGTDRAVIFPACPSIVRSPFAEPTAGVNLELMSSLLMQSPKRTPQRQQSQGCQHQRSHSAEAPRSKLASGLERSRTGGYLDRSFMASLSALPSQRQQVPSSSTSALLASRLHSSQPLPDKQAMVGSTSAQAKQAESELVDLDDLLGDTVAGVLLGRSNRIGQVSLDELL